jgi:hypothetical protein
VRPVRVDSIIWTADAWTDSGEFEDNDVKTAEMEVIRPERPSGGPK